VWLGKAQGRFAGPIKGCPASWACVHEISAAAITAVEKSDHGNGSGSIRLVWGKLLEEKDARRGWPVDPAGAGGPRAGKFGAAGPASRGMRSSRG